MSHKASLSFESPLAKAAARRRTDGALRTSDDPTVPYTAAECENALEFEKLLRDAIGLSARAARRVAPVAWAALQKEAQEPAEPVDTNTPNDTAAPAFAARLRKLNSRLKGPQL
jgi:hypothetical protein